MQRRRVLAYAAGAAATVAAIPLRSHAQTNMTSAHSPIQVAALAEVRRFYAPFHSTPTPTKVRVTVEDFEWNGAVYRIDVAVDEHPIFLPWDSDYAMAHRLWMTADGGTVKSETIYTRPNRDDAVARSSMPPERLGFYPGSHSFSTTLRWIAHALQQAGPLTFAASHAPGETAVRLQFVQAWQDLVDYAAEVTERPDRYLLTLAAVPLPARTQRDINTLTLDINKATGHVSNTQFHFNLPAALM
jgi:hypothetical protein